MKSAARFKVKAESSATSLRIALIFLAERQDNSPITYITLRTLEGKNDTLFSYCFFLDVLDLSTSLTSEKQQPRGLP